MAGLACLARRILLALALPAIVATASGSAMAAALADFFGTYVGNAQEMSDTEPMARDIDIVIQPYRDQGFQIHWITVTKLNGRRDVPGVQRTLQGALFEPAGNRQFYVEVEADNPFREREAKVPMRGHPVRWANVDDDTLRVYSFVVLEDGRYELQIYNRVLTDVGLDIFFQRFDDGELVRQIKGSTVRVQP